MANKEKLLKLVIESGANKPFHVSTDKYRKKVVNPKDYGILKNIDIMALVDYSIDKYMHSGMQAVRNTVQGELDSRGQHHIPLAVRIFWWGAGDIRNANDDVE